MKKVIDQGRGWLSVTNNDSPSPAGLALDSVEYQLFFDVMVYENYDIENDLNKILVSVKIAKFNDKTILYSFIESSRGRDPERICGTTAERLSASVIKSLYGLQKNTHHKVDTLKSAKDSLSSIIPVTP
jgi:hypothetical protein